MATAKKAIKIVSKRLTGKRNLGSKWISPMMRNAIYVRDGMSCLYCGKCRSEGITLTLDHVKAASLGGADLPANLITVCVPCNSSKGARSMAAFCRGMKLSLSAVRADIKKHCARKLDLCAARAIIQYEQSIKSHFGFGFKVRA